jgi:hypothetical protein
MCRRILASHLNTMRRQRLERQKEEGTEVLGHMIVSLCGLRSTVTYAVHGKEGSLLVDARSLRESVAQKRMVFTGGEWLRKPLHRANERMLQH